MNESEAVFEIKRDMAFPIQTSSYNSGRIRAGILGCMGRLLPYTTLFRFSENYVFPGLSWISYRKNNLVLFIALYLGNQESYKKAIDNELSYPWKGLVKGHLLNSPRTWTRENRKYSSPRYISRTNKVERRTITSKD